MYYKDDTHYFVMTAKKQCLLRLGVLRQVGPGPWQGGSGQWALRGRGQPWTQCCPLVWRREPVLFCLCPDIFSTTSSSPLGFPWQPESYSHPLYQSWNYMWF